MFLSSFVSGPLWLDCYIRKKDLLIFLVRDGEMDFKEITSRSNLLLCSKGHGLSTLLLYLFIFSFL